MINQTDVVVAGMNWNRQHATDDGARSNFSPIHSRRPTLIGRNRNVALPLLVGCRDGATDNGVQASDVISWDEATGTKSVLD